MRLLVIGAGNGGAATTVELVQAGHEVALHARSEETLAPFRLSGIRHEGVFGQGRVEPALLTTDLAQAAATAEAAIVALPTFAHAGVARALHAAGWDSKRPIILNPAHTGGVLEVETVFSRLGGPVPPIAGLSTLAYVARKPAPDTVRITGRAKALRVGALPGGEAAVVLAEKLFPGVYDTGNVLAADLSNVNMVLHPPGAMLGAAWVEASRGGFTFYVEGMTPGVLAVMKALDAERRAVALALGQDLPTVIGEMRALGTVPSDADDADFSAIAAGEANRRIMAPDSLTHRYYVEDFAHGLRPFLVYAGIAGVPVPVADALVALHGQLTAALPRPAQRDAAALGLDGATVPSLQRRVGLA